MLIIGLPVVSFSLFRAQSVHPNGIAYAAGFRHLAKRFLRRTLIGARRRKFDYYMHISNSNASFFNYCRPISLQFVSFRSSLRTLQRELEIRFFLIGRDAWFQWLADEVCGSKQALREFQNEKSILFSAFTAGLHHIRRYGPDGVKIRNLLSDAAKLQWRILA